VKALIVSDLHSNAAALRAVMSHVRRKRFDEIICLGDFVGYGAEPNQVLDTMRKVRATKRSIRGNRDRVAAGLEDGATFNPTAREAAVWTRDHLSAPNRKFLAGLPVGPLASNGFVICHGSPFDEDEYVFTDYHAAMVMAHYDAPIVFYGHTHLPAIFSVDAKGHLSGALVRSDATFRLDPTSRYLINPGSVGQPRDRNPQSSFALFDSRKRTVRFFRVPYDVAKTQAAILKAGLPEILASRLTFGT
jgi:predicted phosphodiesterase